MKEIIYLDTNLVNSLLAQQNAGLVTKLVNENSESDSNAEGGFEQSTTTVSGGFTALVKADGNHSTTENENYNIVFSRSNRNLIETALDDYSLDLLLQELENDKLLKSSDFRDGDFVFTVGRFDFFDFEQLKNVSTFDEIEDIEKTVYAYVQSQIDEYGLDAEIVDVVVAGIRCRGIEQENSDFMWLWNTQAPLEKMTFSICFMRTAFILQAYR